MIWSWWRKHDEAAQVTHSWSVPRLMLGDTRAVFLDAGPEAVSFYESRNYALHSALSMKKVIKSREDAHDGRIS